jgi:hypothetical protein
LASGEERRVMGKCFYCGAEASGDVPALVPYCVRCWDDEHPNVRARLAGDAERFDSVEAALVAKLGRTGDSLDVPR